MNIPLSPFAVGRPLKATEPLFGREETFTLTHAALDRFESVNLVGERRMGKTSFLNHLMDNPQQRPAPGTPPLLLARVDLQNITDARRFYGLAIREILAALSDPTALTGSAALLLSLQPSPDADFDSFERLLRQLADNHLGRPVLLVDEFEQLLEPRHHTGFQLPQFYNGLRALITANRLALVVASRLPLAEHFQRLPAAMTSTFPSYLTPQHLRELDNAAADNLLLQGTACGLGLAEVLSARDWAGGHPCRLQCAGQAWYEAKRFNHDLAWTKRRYEEFRRQNCFMRSPSMPLMYRFKQAWHSMLHWPRRLCVTLPLLIGRWVQKLGSYLSDVTALLVGAGIILAILEELGWKHLDWLRDLINVIKERLS